MPSSARLASIERRISSGERDGLADQLRLLDGHHGRGRHRLLDHAEGHQAADRAQQEQDQRDDQEPEPRAVARAQDLPHAPGGGVEQVDQAEQGEDARDRAGDDAADQLRDLLGQLGLGERDLLADQQLHLLGDLLDRLADLRGAGFSHRCW
jgi:hypothetical protein